MSIHTYNYLPPLFVIMLRDTSRSNKLYDMRHMGCDIHALLELVDI